MMQMYNLLHPGEIIKELCLEPLGLTVYKSGRSARCKPQDPVGHPQRSGQYRPEGWRFAYRTFGTLG